MAIEHSAAGARPDLAPFERAPTLLNGENGSGEVRVWPSDMSLLRRSIVQTAKLLLLVGAGTVTLVWFVRIWIGHGDFVGWFAGCFLLLARLSNLTAAYLRPRYVTSDGEGLAFTTRRGSKCQRWQDIREVDYSSIAQVTFRRSPGKDVVLCWIGHQGKDRAALRDLVIAPAKLEPADKPGVYRRAGAVLAPPAEASRELRGGR